MARTKRVENENISPTGETEPGKGCILVARTQPERLYTLCILLTRHGYAVRPVSGSSSVLKAVHESRPDLIFLDAAPPAGDSYETCELLKANPHTRDIPVILVLAQPDHGSRLDSSSAFAAGAADYVTEPFQEQEILSRVQTQLALAAMRSQVAEKDARLERALAKRTGVEQVLQEDQSEFLTSVLESLTHPFYVLDAHDYTVQIANSAARLGSQVGQATCYALTHGRDMPCGSDSHPCTVEEIKRTKKPVKVEHVHYDAEGHARNVEVHGYPLLDDDGNVARVIEYTLDITERKQVEDALREREETWRSLTEYSPDYIMLLDREAKILFVNHTLPELSREQVIGTSFYDHALEEYRQVAQECFDRVLRTGQPDRFESVYVDRDGNRVAFESYVGPVMRAGKVWGLTVRSTDITERREAEEALRQGEREYRQLLNALQEGIWVIDQDACTTFVNPRMAEMLGYTVEEMQGKHLFSFMDERGIEITQRNLQRREQGIAEQHDFEFLRKDGSRIVALLETSPIYDDDGNYVGGIAGIQDITQRRRAEQALQKSEALLAETQRMAKVGGWELNLDTSEVIWTEEVYRIHEVPPDFEPALESALAFYAPEDRPVLEGAIQRAAKTGEPWDLELRFNTARGDRLWVRAIGKAERQDGRVARLSGTFQDITDRKQAEQALRESEARWRLVTETSPDHVMLLDRDLVIEFVNRASPGLTVEELIGTPLYTYVSEERQAEIKQILESVRDTAELRSYETEFRTPYGNVIYYESRAVPRFIDDQVVGLAVTARDITAHKQAEQALQQAKEVAEHARLEEWERRQEADRRRQIAEGLADVLTALNSNQPLDQILDFIALQARHLLDNHAVAIYRLQDTAGTLALQTAKGLPAGYVAGTDTPPGLEALRQAVSARQPVLVPELADSLPSDGRSALDTDGPMTEAAGSTFCRALLAVPIVVQDEVYGGMLLYYAEPRSFSGDDLDLASVFGDQVALAIENARLREQVKQAAATAERSRLARDLHDSVTQALFSASLVAEVLPQVWQRDPEEAQQGLEELRHLTRGALAEMRTLLLELRPTALLETRLDDLLRQLTEAITSRAQLSATVHIEPSPLLPPDVHVTFYRVTQEALHNTVKHAGANCVNVSLQASPAPDPALDSEWQGRIELRVTDDGQGFDPGRTDPNQLGLGIMHERAASVRARLAIESQPGQGTRVILVWHNTPKGEREHHD